MVCKNNTLLNLEHLYQRMKESGDFTGNTLSEDVFKEMLFTKIETLNIKQAIDEVSPFVKNTNIFDFWSKEYFMLLASKIKIKS